MATSKQIDEFIRQARRVGAAGTGSWLPELTADRVSVVQLSDGRILNGVKPSMESGFHLNVMRNRPDVGVVLHFQSPYATAVACMKSRPDNFNFTAEMALHVGEEIPMIPYFRPGSPQLAEHVIKAMETHNSVMLLKHGQVVCGADFDQAFERAMFFEMGCRIAVLDGANVDPLTRSEIDDLESYFLGKEGK